MNLRTVRRTVDGPVGPLDCAIDSPEGPSRGVALVCHPHPLQGGTFDNKVVQTLARAFVQLGWQSVRFNLRGVGASAGVWDEGRGEVDDALAVLNAFRMLESATDPIDATVVLPAGESATAPRVCLVAGFSFGGYVAASVFERLPDAHKPLRLVLVGPSTQKHTLPVVPSDTLVVHGENDDVVPLLATLDWARPQGLPVVVFPGGGHFFHGALGALKSVVLRELCDVGRVAS